MSIKDLFIIQREKVREAFGKSDKDVAKDIEIIKKWIKTQPHLPEMPSDNMIEYFLTSNKFSIERAKPKLDMYYSIRSLIPEVYEHKHPKLPHMQQAAKMALVCALPKLTEDLNRVYIYKVTVDPEAFDFDNMIAHYLNLLEIQIQEDLMVAAIFILDYEYLKMGHVTKITPMHLKKQGTILEKVFSNRVKDIHIINHPPFIDILLNIAKAVLKEKIIERIHLHNNVQDLYQYISKDVLPSDYGGEEKSLKELDDLGNLMLKEYGDRFEKLENMKVNEKLRPEPLKNDDILGFHGNFKTLDVD